MQGFGSPGRGGGGCGAGSSPRCLLPSCFPCQDFLPSLESSGDLIFEAQDPPCRKSRGFGGEKRNGLICLSLSQSIPEERGWEQTAQGRSEQLEADGLRATSSGILFVLSEQNYKGTNKSTFSGKMSFIPLPIRHSGWLEQVH